MEFHDKHWKRELKGHADQIAKIELDEETNETFEAERPIFYSAFIVRKLIEDTAVTDALKSRSVDVLAYPSTRGGQVVFLEAMLGPLQVEDHFDFNAGKRTRISYNDLTSEIIHSDGFVWIIPHAPPPHAFLVFSYRNTLTRAIGVTVEAYLGMLRDVLRDDPRHWWTMMDAKTGKVTIHAGHRLPKRKVVTTAPPPWAADLWRDLQEPTPEEKQ
ncbi:MAG TPA: hypothetical protein VGX71_07975 [Pseudaminobacter sp.]|nr:hypothetical protein [Pseudaminobacter sp.]